MAKKITRDEIKAFLKDLDAIQLTALASLAESEAVKKFKKFKK